MNHYLVLALLLNMGIGEVERWINVRAENEEEAIKQVKEKYLTIKILKIEKN